MIGKKGSLILICALFIVSSGAQISAEEKQRSFFLILAPGLSFTEGKWFLENGSQELWNSAQWSGMNVRPDGSYSYLNNTVSLSTGSRAVGVQHWNSFELEESWGEAKAGDLQYQWTGRYPQETLVHPFFHKLRNKNLEAAYKSHVGILGESLKTAKVRRYVLGNSDLGQEEKLRYGSLFTVDKHGDADGVLLDVVKRNTQAPYGLEMDSEQLLKRLEQVLVSASSSPTFYVIEWGDMFRLFQQKPMMTDDYFQQKYETSLANLEQFLEKMIEKQAGNVLLLSPMMNEREYKANKKLAPMWYWDIENVYDGNMLMSATTQQKHIVSNIDLAPTILAYFQVEQPQEMLGHPFVSSTDEKATAQEVLSHLDWVFTIYSTRSVILPSYITVLVLLLLAVAVLLWKRKTKEHCFTLAKIVLVAAISSPFWLLVMTKLLTIVSVSLYFWLFVLSSLLTGWLMVKYVAKPFFWVGLAHFIVITIDLLLGSPLMQRSYLGYDPIIGARYYGIGNEYAGVYIISALFVLYPLFKKEGFYYWIIPFVIMFQLILLGAANLGTNAGATLAAGIAYVYLLIKFFPFPRKGIGIKRKHWLRLTLYICVPILLIGGLYLLQFTGRTTHIGYAFNQLWSGNFSYIWDIIKRKAEMNWKIFRFSNWTQLFVTSYVLIGVLMWRKREQLCNGEEKVVLQTGIVASVALLLLNDSGVVAAATSMFLLVTVSYYWLLEKKEDNLSV